MARTSANAQTVTSRTQYEPYGATAGGTNPAGPGFTGHVNDQNGLVHMQERYYDPIAGRFLSVDPVVTDAATGKSFGRYHYASNNPYRYTDPDGRGIVPTGTKAEIKETRKPVDQIGKSGPNGKAFIDGLRNDPAKVITSQGTSAAKNDGTVVPLSSLGGGITLRPSESKSGNIEIVFDKKTLTTYTATNGSGVKETPAGLLLHELGHGASLIKGDPAQNSGGLRRRKTSKTLRIQSEMKWE